MPPMMTSEVAEKAAKNAKEKIAKLLTPLLSDRDQLLSEEADLKDKYDAKKAERISVERVLRSNGLIETNKRSSQSKQEKDAAGNREMAPTILSDIPTKVQDAIDEIEAMNGEEFQIGMIAKRAGADRRAVEKAIGHLRGEDRIRLLGTRPQLTRNPNSPGGRSAATFQEIK